MLVRSHHRLQLHGLHLLDLLHHHGSKLLKNSAVANWFCDWRLDCEGDTAFGTIAATAEGCTHSLHC